MILFMAGAVVGAAAVGGAGWAWWVLEAEHRFEPRRPAPARGVVRLTGRAPYDWQRELSERSTVA